MKILPLLLACQERAQEPLRLIQAMAGSDLTTEQQARLQEVQKDLTPGLSAQALDCLRGKVAKGAQELNEILCDCRAADENVDYLRFFSNYLVRLGKLQERLQGQSKGLLAVVKEFDVESEREFYGLSQLAAIEDLTKRCEARGKARDEAERLAAERELDATLRGRVLDANSMVKTVAKRTVPHYTGGGKAVDNMVCVVTNTATGTRAEGRAGHGMGHDVFENLLFEATGTRVKISKISANMNAVGNTVNCAEWQALKDLLAKEKVTGLRGKEPSTYSQLYFAAAVPGKRGGLIPPCPNCKRLMNFLFAKAFEYTPASRSDSID